MTQSPSLATQAVLSQLSTRRRQRLRKNIQLMFLGMSAAETDPILRLLRASRLAPRGHEVNSEEEFLDALSERSWDIILCTAEQNGFSAKNAMHHLRRLDKDIPLIQLVPSSESQYLLQGLKNNIQAVVPLEEKELLIIHIRRELENLDNRRKLRQTESALSEVERQYESMLESSRRAIACCDGDTILFANQSLAQVLGFESSDTLIGTSLSFCFSPDQKEAMQQQIAAFQNGSQRSSSLQLTAVRADGSEFEGELMLRQARFNNTPCVQITLNQKNASEDQDLQDKLDLVSGLFNLTHFNNELDETLEAALSGGADCNLLYISLDNYLEIRSDIGIEGCDQVVRDVGAVLKKHVNQAHLLARPEEDSFAVIYRDPSPDKAVALANKLCKAIEGNLSEFSNTTIQTTGSIGIATISDNTPTRKAIIERARSAAETIRAENQLGNGVQLYQAAEKESDEHSEQVEQLEDAIRHNKLKPLFQPVVALDTQKNSHHHYEVFLRIIAADGEEVSPRGFMETLEEDDIAIKLDRWVIKQTMVHLQRAFRKNQCNRVFINLCARTLKDRKTLLWLSELLRKAGLPANHVIFQISETDALGYLKHAKLFADNLRKMHFGVCLKHYGRSINSELILKHIKPDYVRLDMPHLDALCAGGDESKPVLELITHFKANGIATIAPTVDSTKGMSTLWKAGVDFIQGNYLQPPQDEMNYDFFDG